MRTIKCASIVAGIISLLTFGIILVDWLILIFLIPLIILLFAGLISFYNDDIKIEVKRDLSHIKIYEFDTVEVTLRIRNLGESISLLEIFDKLPDKIKVIKGSNYALIDLKKNEEIELKYEILCPIRGRFFLGTLLFRVRNFFGLFYKEAIIESSSYITVIPRVEEISDIEIKAKANIYPGIMHIKHAGIGTEFYGIRNYTTGDTYKRINWKTFARLKELMVNEFELESTTDVIIIVDGRETQSTGTIKHNAMEYGIKAAVSIASHFLKRRDRVGQFLLLLIF